MEIYFLHKRGGEHERAVENAQKNRGIFSCEIFVEPVCHLLYRLLYLPVRHVEPEIFVVKFYAFHNAGTGVNFCNGKNIY